MHMLACLVGKKLVKVRPMTADEMRDEGWVGPSPTVLVFEDGTTLYASCDEEGNGPGALFGRYPDGSHGRA